MAYLKPQSPIKFNEDHIYPLTTVDQIIMDDGNRLSGVGVYLDKPEESEDTTLEPGVNADTLGGVLAENYALKSGTIANADNATNFSGYTFDALKAYMLDLAHPVGSYYWSKEATNPSTMFGGVWEQVKDKFILAAGDSYNIGTTGGAASVTLTSNQIPSHNHTANKLTGTINVRGWEDSGLYGNTATASGVFTVNKWSSKAYVIDRAGSTVDNVVSGFSFNATPAINNTGGGKSHENMPPYITAYCWCRTA